MLLRGKRVFLLALNTPADLPNETTWMTFCTIYIAVVSMEPKKKNNTICMLKLYHSLGSIIILVLYLIFRARVAGLEIGIFQMA